MFLKKEKKSCTFFKCRMSITDRYWTNSDVTWNALLHIYLKSTLVTDVFSYKTSQLYYLPFCFVSLKIFLIYVSTSFKPTSWSMPDIHMYIHTNVHKCHHFSLRKMPMWLLFFVFKQSLWFFKFKQSFCKIYIHKYISEEKKEKVMFFFLRADRLNIMKRFWKNSHGKWNIVFYICIKGIPITDVLLSYKLSQFYYFRNFFFSLIKF